MSRTNPTPDGLLRQVESGLKAAGILPGEGIVVAVSGGVDSVVLLDILHRLASPMELHLHVAHLDHQLRCESQTDACFVEALAARLGWPATIESVDVGAVARNQGLSMEQAGRACRRDMWTRVGLQASCRWVAVGHHADDQAETVLLRLLRGAGTTGLGAMRPVTAGIVRPLLAVRRSAVEAYAVHRGLEVRQDPTNRDVRVPRNQIRHELLPILARQHNPRIVEGLARTARLLQADDDYLDGVSREAARVLLKERRRACLKLDSELLGGYHIAIQRRVLRQYIQELAQYYSGLDLGNSGSGMFAAVDCIIDRLAAGSTGMYQVAGVIWAENTVTDLILRRGLSALVPTAVVLPGQVRVTELSMTLNTAFVSQDSYARLKSRLGTWRAAFDARAADGMLQLRSPQPGDRIRPLGMGGHHKKLSDCFIDAKWPRILRSDALVLTHTTNAGTEEVLWIAGLTRSEAFQVTPDSDSILYLEFVNADSPEPGATNPPTCGPMT